MNNSLDIRIVLQLISRESRVNSYVDIDKIYSWKYYFIQSINQKEKEINFFIYLLYADDLSIFLA